MQECGKGRGSEACSAKTREGGNAGYDGANKTERAENSETEHGGHLSHACLVRLACRVPRSAERAKESATAGSTRQP